MHHGLQPQQNHQPPHRQAKPPPKGMQGHNLLLGKPNRALRKNVINAKSHESTTTSMKSTVLGSKMQIRLFERLLAPSG